MTAMRFLATVTATAEVRDADGNLVSSEPVQTEIELTEQQARELMNGEAP